MSSPKPQTSSQESATRTGLSAASSGLNLLVAALDGISPGSAGPTFSASLLNGVGRGTDNLLENPQLVDNSGLGHPIGLRAAQDNALQQFSNQQRQLSNQQLQDIVIVRRLMELSQENDRLKQQLLTVHEPNQANGSSGQFYTHAAIAHCTNSLPTLTSHLNSVPVSLPHDTEQRRYAWNMQADRQSQLSRDSLLHLPIPLRQVPAVLQASEPANNSHHEQFHTLPQSLQKHTFTPSMATNSQSLLALSLLQAALPQLPSSLPCPSLARPLETHAMCRPAKQESPDTTTAEPTFDKRMDRAGSVINAVVASVSEQPLQPTEPDDKSVNGGHAEELVKLQDSAFSALTSNLSGKQYLRYKLLEKQNRLAEAHASQNDSSPCIQGETSNSSSTLSKKPKASRAKRAKATLLPPLSVKIEHGEASFTDNESTDTPADQINDSLVPQPESDKAPAKKRSRKVASGGEGKPKSRKRSATTSNSDPLGTVNTQTANSDTANDIISAIVTEVATQQHHVTQHHLTPSPVTMTPVIAAPPLDNSNDCSRVSSPRSSDSPFSRSGSSGGGAPTDRQRYMERRRRNNEAAKRCRANRRAMFELHSKRSQELEDENLKLREEMLKLTKELDTLKQLVAVSGNSGVMVAPMALNSEEDLEDAISSQCTESTSSTCSGSPETPNKEDTSKAI